MQKNILILLILIPVHCSSEGQTFKQVKPPTSSEVPFAKKQLQVISLFNNLNCVKDRDKDLVTTSNTFDPLKNLNLYTNPDVVESYFTNLEDGNYQSRLGTFYFTSDQLAELLQFFDIIWRINDWELLFNTTAYAVTRMNTQMFNWALSGLLASKSEYVHFKQPTAYEVFPQTHFPKWIVRRANGDTAPYPTKPADPSDPENALIYWRHEPGLSQCHQNWHAYFPFWWRNRRFNIIKGRKGESFMYFHHSIMTRYRAERLSHGMNNVLPLDLDKPVSVGDIPVTLNVDLTELPSRKPDLFLQNVPGVTVADMQNWQDRLLTGIDEGYFVNVEGEEISLRTDAGNQVLGATIEASRQSVDFDYYGDLHQDAHLLVAWISDPNETHGPPGIQAHLEQSPQDPAFYVIHSYINMFDRKQQFKLPRYTDKDFEFPGVTLNSLRIGNDTSVGGVPVLKTFFENFTFDITNSILTCKDINSGKRAKATIRRLNYQPFEYKMIAFSSKSKTTRGIFRIFMSPVMGFNNKPVSREELFWNMFEMDRFPVTLTPGRNEIRRSSKESSVAIPDRPSVKQLIKDVRKSVAETGGLKPYPPKLTRLCGWPQNLLLPRGTKEGMKFKMYVILTTAATGDYDENEYPSLPLCANPTGFYPDGVPMGFPFNRRIAWSALNVGTNYKSLDLIIRHE